jgi:cephalosporin hydroxylase
MIELVEGSSTDERVVESVRRVAARHDRVLVLLDSNHTGDHVLKELRAYAPLVSPMSYCVVFDTVVERLPADLYPDRPWSPGNSPMTAVDLYLQELAQLPAEAADGARLEFEIDHEMDAKLILSVAPRGYLRRVTGHGLNGDR